MTTPEKLRRDLDTTTVFIFAELDAIKAELRLIRQLLTPTTCEDGENDGRQNDL